MHTEHSRKFLSRNAIKYMAMLTMLLNHIAAIFLKSGTLLHALFTTIGYFTAISMVYFLIEGFDYTRSKKRYLSRLFVFAVISEIPYCLAFTQGKIIEFHGMDILFTLCLCFVLMDGLARIPGRGAKVLLTLAVLFASLFCDWALFAPLFTLLFLWAKGCAARTKAAFLISALLFGLFSFAGDIGRFPPTVNLVYALLGMAGMGLAGLCITRFYNGQKAKHASSFSKWFFYAFYPGHLLILGMIRILMGR